MDSVTQHEVAGRLVRRAVVSEVPALVELRAQMFLAMGSAGVESSEWRVSAQDWFISHLDDARVRIVEMEVGQRLVSTAMAAVRDSVPSPSCPAGGDVLVSKVCTLPDARKQGHGQVAFAAVLDWARSTGVARAEVKTSLPESRGVHLRRSCSGWRARDLLCRSRFRQDLVPGRQRCRTA